VSVDDASAIGADLEAARTRAKRGTKVDHASYAYRERAFVRVARGPSTQSRSPRGHLAATSLPDGRGHLLVT
jgi:hypothetical protein